MRIDIITCLPELVESPLNHSYVRRPVNARDDFYALWADGNARSPSQSKLYFCNKKGEVFLLPPRMEQEMERPLRRPFFAIDRTLPVVDSPGFYSVTRPRGRTATHRRTSDTAGGVRGLRWRSGGDRTALWR